MALTAVQIDRREPAHIQALGFGGAEKRVVELAAGDLVGTCADGAQIAIERKTPSDLLNTLRQDRLYSQVARLRALTPWAYLVVTGALFPGPGGEVRFQDGSGQGGESDAGTSDLRESGWTWSRVQGTLLTCQELGVCVLFGGDGEDYEALVLRLAERDRSPVRIAPARGSEPLTEQETLLTGLPGIGPSRARGLLLAYGTPARAIEALTQEPAGTGKRVPVAPGIGPGIRRRVRAVMGLQETAALVVDGSASSGTSGVLSKTELKAAA